MALRKAYHANCWGPLGGDAVGVTSITQLTYRTFGDMEQAVSEIGDAGYSGTELFDGNLLDYEGRLPSFSRVLKNAGVKLLAVYSGGNFIFDFPAFAPTATVTLELTGKTRTQTCVIAPAVCSQISTAVVR